MIKFSLLFVALHFIVDLYVVEERSEVRSTDRTLNVYVKPRNQVAYCISCFARGILKFNN